MVLSKRYCVDYDDGSRQCYREDGFWYSDKGIIIKWIIFSSFFLFFFAWFVGGHYHAKQRLRKGLPLMGYHRFLVSYRERSRYGQNGVPQNHFTFYQSPQNAYQPNGAPYQQRQDGAWAEPPPQYMGNDAPPQYFAPPGATKMSPNQHHGNGVEMPLYGASQGMPQGAQQNGVVGPSASASGSGSGSGDLEQGHAQPQTQAQAQEETQPLPPRPATAKTKLFGMVDRLRK